MVGKGFPELRWEGFTGHKTRANRVGLENSRQKGPVARV